MVIVVGEPLAQLVSSLFLAGEWSGVEELLGQDTVVALDFAVVPRRAGVYLFMIILSHMYCNPTNSCFDRASIFLHAAFFRGILT